eukprot:29528-Chlamydomonas_euryale.AAC.4
MAAVCIVPLPPMRCLPPGASSAFLHRPLLGAHQLACPHPQQTHTPNNPLCRPPPHTHPPPPNHTAAATLVLAGARFG